MPTVTKAQELRDKAKAAKIPNWKSMDRAELEQALKTTNGAIRSPRMAKAVAAMGHAPARRGVKRASENKAISEGVKARKAAKRKAQARKEVIKKAGTKPRKAAPSSGVNPFRPGSQLNAITEELLVGGKRQSIINRLRRRFEIHGYAQKDEAVDMDFEWDKRLLMCREKLVAMDWTFEADGRGREGTLKVFPPSTRSAAARKRPAAKKPARTSKRR